MNDRPLSSDQQIPAKTSVAEVVNQCYHEGCQWCALTEENRRLREIVSEMNAKAKAMQKQIEGISAWLRKEMRL